MRNRNVSIRIRVEDAGCTVLEFLSRRFTYHDRNRWETIIREGKICLNGKPPFPDTFLKPQDILAYVGFDETEPPVRIDYDILYEDEVLLVVNKPANLPCHPGGRYFKHTLWHLLTVRYDPAPLYFVNRIDRETSGMVLVAKSPWQPGTAAGNLPRDRFKSDIWWRCSAISRRKPFARKGAMPG